MTHQHVRWMSIVSFVAAFLAATALFIVWLNIRGDPDLALDAADEPAATPQWVERGAYLVRVGNCAGCHTPRGGPSFAGTVGIATPFGTVFASNLTPDPVAGIGRWSSTDFWRAMHNGRSKDGRLLYPAFPYPDFTLVSREDSDAIYAYLRTLPPSAQPNTAHALQFPYDRQAALAVWRALYFRPVSFQRDSGQTPEWNRGAYLVRGLGHCIACHSSRNPLGATTGKFELAGGMIPVQNWYAPSLASADEAGVASWNVQEITTLLATGNSSQGSVLGPMADVVFQSTQHFSASDLRAVAVFLKSLPQTEGMRTSKKPDPSVMARGANLYRDKCVECHGEKGRGLPQAYPPLSGNRMVTMTSTTNVVRAVTDGGFPPATAGNPRPYGMPPFGQSLSNADIAAVVTFIRNSWGNEAGPVSELDIFQVR